MPKEKKNNLRIELFKCSIEGIVWAHTFID